MKYDYKYIDADKLFSPAWDSKKYKKHLMGLSTEFCHDLYRLIMRPNSKSASHWFRDSIDKLNDAIGLNITVRTKPVWFLFSFLLDKNEKGFPIGSNSSFMYHKVRRELMYGEVLNNDLEYIESKVKELYVELDPDKIYSDEEVYRLYQDWYSSIDGSNQVFISE